MDRYRVAPEHPVDLSAIDPRATDAFEGEKPAGKREATLLAERIRELQELLYAEGKHKLLVVLQATDAGGKDGTIRHVFGAANPQGVRVTSFKVPSERERAHDYLWRVHRHTPASGEIAIFNRSHYEDVLVVRVDGLAPEDRWRRRYRHIVEFERLLADEGTTIMKFFLHISKAEQKDRFQKRLDKPHKRWKFSHGDLAKRAKWDAYRAAYEEMLTRTSTRFAPWYVIPADRKWYRNLVIGRLVVDRLESLQMAYPQPAEDLSEVVIP